MSNKRIEVKKAKLKRRKKQFVESGGTGNSKYAAKSKAHRGGKYSKNSPFVAVKDTNDA